MNAIFAADISKQKKRRRFPFKIKASVSYKDELKKISAEVLDEVSTLVKEYYAEYKDNALKNIPAMDSTLGIYHRKNIEHQSLKDTIENEKYDKVYLAEYDTYISDVYMDLAINLESKHIKSNKLSGKADEGLIAYMNNYKFDSGKLQKNMYYPTGDSDYAFIYRIKSRPIMGQTNWDICVPGGTSYHENETLQFHIILYVEELGRI